MCGGDQQGTSTAGRGHMSPLAAGGTEGQGSRASSSSCSLCTVLRGDFPLAGASWGHPSEESQGITETALPCSVPLAEFVLLEFMLLLSIAM